MLRHRSVWLARISDPPPRYYKGTLPHLNASLDIQARLHEDAVDGIPRMKRVHVCHLWSLRSKMLPPFRSGGVDVIHHRVSTWLQHPSEITCVQPDHP